MKEIFTLITSIASCLVGFGANYHEIKGVVKDADNNSPLAGASIQMLHENKGILTDQQGGFTLDMTQHAAGVQVVVSYSGYHNDTLSLSATVPFYTLLLKPVTGILNDVVVSVGGRTLVRENPVAITLVSSQKIDQTLQSNIIDVLVKNVPGLNAVKTGPNISKPFIRGLGYSRILTLYDGVRQEGQQWGDEHGIEIDPYGIEKAEVVKGPVSLIYGSDALAGIVSMMPFVPNEQDGKIHGRITSEYQHNNGLIGNGGRLYSSTQNWYFVASGSYRMAKNYQNTVDGRVYNTNFKETSAGFSLGHTSTAGRSSLNFTLFNDLQGIPDGSRDSLTRKFTKQIYEGNQDDLTSRPFVSAHELNSYTLSPLHQHIQHYRIYSNNHYKIGPGQIEASLAWQQNDRQEFSHPTAPEKPGMYVQLNTLNYGLKYTLPLDSHTDLSIGANGMQQSNKNKDATDFPIPDYRLGDLGGFAFAKWKHNRLTFSGGARYDFRNIDGESLYTEVNQNTGFEEQTSGSKPDAKQQFNNFHKSFSGLSLSLGSTYAINQNISIKANIARGYRAPNITELASNGLDPGAHIIYIGNMSAKPEFSFQQDLGMELAYPSVDGAISIFNNHISHYIYLTESADQGVPIEDAQGNKTFQYQHASAHLYGMELSTSIHPKSWNGFSWTNNLALTYGFNTDPLYKDQGTQGSYLPYIPPATWLSNATQAIELKGSLLTQVKLMAEADYNSAQNRYLGLFNTETATPAYTLINLAATTTWQYTKQQKLSLQLAVNNLCNTVYQSNMSRLKYFEYYSDSPNNYKGIYGIGRNICVKLILPL